MFSFDEFVSIGKLQAMQAVAWETKTRPGGKTAETWLSAFGQVFFGVAIEALRNLSRVLSFRNNRGHIAVRLAAGLPGAGMIN